MSFYRSILIIFCAWTIISATSAATCNYFINSDGLYGCCLDNVFINETNQVLEIDGVHLEGKDNSDVEYLTFPKAEFYYLVRLNYMTRSIFETFPNLVYVDLRRTMLEQISSNDFFNCMQFRTVLMAENLITNYRAGIFAACSNIEVLSIGGASLITIDDSTFDGLQLLKNLELHYVPNLTWRMEFLQPLINLRNLTIHYSSERITTFPENLLYSLPNLEIFHSYGARKLPSTFFQNSVKLKQVTASYNFIESIDDIFLHPLVELELLDLTSNVISTIHPNAFLTCTNLKKLILESNGIKTLDPKTFLSLGNLHTLSLTRNEITSYDEELFKPLHSLLSLDISWNNLRNLSTPINIESLLTLSASANLITQISGNNFEKLINLQMLSLSLNNLYTISSNAFYNNQQLTYIDFNINRISELRSDMFVANTRLEVLDFQWNNIDFVDPQFPNSVSNLKFLNLVRNLCIDTNFTDSNITSMSDVMEPCFKNFESTTSTTASAVTSTSSTIPIETEITASTQGTTSLASSTITFKDFGVMKQLCYIIISTIIIII